MSVELLGKVRARGDVLGFDGGAGLGDRVERSVDARLDVQLAGRGDEQPHLALADELDDPLAHGKAGPVQVLAGVGHAGVRARRRCRRRRGSRRRAPACTGSLNASRSTSAHGDPVGPAGDRRLEGVDHLADVGDLRAGPLRRREAEQRRGVLDPVDRRDPERVRRHVVDEHEVPLRRLREVPGGRRPATRRDAAVPVGGEGAGSRRDASGPHQRAPGVAWLPIRHVKFPLVDGQSDDLWLTASLKII